MTFNETLKQLKTPIDPKLIKQRVGYTDKSGNQHYLDYVEWHTVTDLLDEAAPDWSFKIVKMEVFGEFITCVGALTINGVTREGIGVGDGGEMGIKAADSDSLKRAAAKFGVGRELYKKEQSPSQSNYGGGQSNSGPRPEYGADVTSENAISKSLSDLVTAKQLGMIRAIARDLGIDPDAECQTLLKCNTDELSKKGASKFIQHIQDMQNGKGQPAPVKRVGDGLPPAKPRNPPADDDWITGNESKQTQRPEPDDVPW